MKSLPFTELQKLKSGNRDTNEHAEQARTELAITERVAADRQIVEERHLGARVRRDGFRGYRQRRGRT